MYLLTAREIGRFKAAGVVIQDENSDTIPCQGMALCVVIVVGHLYEDDDIVGYADIACYEAYIDGIQVAELSVRLERYHSGGAKWLAPLRRKYVIWRIMRILNV